MKYSVVTTPLQDVSCEALVVLTEGSSAFACSSNTVLNAHVASYCKDVKEKRSSREWFCTLDNRSGLKTRHVLLDSADFGSPLPGREKLKRAAARAAETCRAYSLHRIAYAVHHKDAGAVAAAILEGVITGDFRDQRFKGRSARKRPELELVFAVEKEQLKAVRGALERAWVVARGVNTARLLVNAPSDVLTPAELAQAARGIARRGGMKAVVLDEKALLRQKYEPTYAVGKGAIHPPRMIVLSYRPKRLKSKLHVALVGKGMTFDTGGLCLKTREGMSTMICDMGGAAAVLGAMEAIAALDLPIRVTAVITSAHNAIGSRAMHPQDILKARNGRTIHVENTDAEGRLILTDALYRAGEEGAELIIDLATLTGAQGLALGPSIAALFTDDLDLRERLLKASEESGDSLWPMPLWPEYHPLIEHHFADLNNMGGDPKGGAIHAANFLKDFVPENTRWAHLDIASPAYSVKRYRYLAPGGTGFGVRVLVRAIEDLCR